VVSLGRRSEAQTLACRLCGGRSTFAFAVGDRNRGIGTQRFDYRRCTVCKSIFLTTVPSDLARYYAAEGYGSPDDVEVPEFVQREEAKLELVRRFTHGDKMVEIGPGPGRFTRVAVRAGFDITAIEMDPEYCRHLRDALSVNAIQSNDPAEVLPTLAPSAVVAMWHVIEHLADPWRVLASCVENLQPGGVLAVSTPNPNSFQLRLFGRYWAHVDAPRHLQLIPFGTLRSRAAQLGMRHVLITTTDPVGLECNRLSWEYALRRHPARYGATPAIVHRSIQIARALSGIERRRLAGTTYTALFQRPAAET
jgi:2-polyprenyl-3-methyl-5-hydroxy-6-metoxy-1,4-benzoquinol methylase